MQQGDYTSAPYYQFPHLQNPIPNPVPNPNPIFTDPLPNPYASAPPFNSDYTTTYPPYPQNPDPTPTPTLTPTPTPPSPTAPPSYPNFPPFTSSSQPASFPPFESHLSYQPQPQPHPQPLPHQHQPQSYYPPYDQHQTAPIYTPSPPPSSVIPPNPNPNPNPLYSSPYSAPYTHPGSSAFEAPFENPVKLDHSVGGYFDDGGYGGFNRSSRSDSYGDGVFAYEGGKVEPYGARGTASKSSTWSSFDDYGRAISFPSGKEGSGASKIVKAVPKVDVNEDVKSGVQKFRVKVLAESGGQSTMDVLCQV